MFHVKHRGHAGNVLVVPEVLKTPCGNASLLRDIGQGKNGSLVTTQPVDANDDECTSPMRVGDVPPFDHPASVRVIAIANQKGGVGKTTTAVNLAASLALGGLLVMIIDLDPQGNACTALGVAHDHEQPSMYEVMVEDGELADAVESAADIEGLRVARSTIDLAGAEVELVPRDRREFVLAAALTEYLAHEGAKLDYVLIDCPPSLGLLTINALVAAKEVLIPIQCEYYALEGLGQLLKVVELTKPLNPELSVSAILLTMFDGRTRLAAQVADEVRQHFPDTVLSTAIPRSVRLSEAPGYGQSVLTYDPASSGARAYLAAAAELTRADEMAALRAMAPRL